MRARGEACEYVGLNESSWIKEPAPEVVTRERAVTGAGVPIAATWQVLWEGSGLHDRVVEFHQGNRRGEVRSRIQWVGWRWAVTAVG
jgi:hypothetical protein